jgi:hypothetical protein
LVLEHPYPDLSPSREKGVQLRGNFMPPFLSLFARLRSSNETLRD